MAVEVEVKKFNPPTPRLKEITLNGKGKLILTKGLMDQIDYLHKKVGGIEWCGILFYKKLSGEINNPTDFVLQAEQIYPMNIGSETYTEAELEGVDVVDMYEYCNPDYELKQGLIHTHHNMATFFSGTDMAELHDNSPLHNYYLSLIVNIRGEYTAKIAYVADVVTNKVTYKSLEFVDSTDTKQKVETSNQENDTEKVLIMMDLVIEKPEFQEVVPTYFQERWAILKQKREEARAKKATQYYHPTSNHGQSNKEVVYDQKRYVQQGELFVGENVTGKALQKAREAEKAQKGSGKLVNEMGQYISATPEEITELIIEWLNDGLAADNDMAPTGPFITVGQGIAFYENYFKDKDSDLDNFLRLMQKYAKETFREYNPKLIRRMVTSILSGWLETSIGTDLYNIIDMDHDPVDFIEDPLDRWQNFNV